jgi:AraC-like DNA-binding protein
VIDDPLSDALATMRARCVVSGGFTAGGDWGIRFWPQARLKIVAVVRGECWLSVDGGGDPVPLAAGDAAVLNGWSHVALSSALGGSHPDRSHDFLDAGNSVLALSDRDDVAIVGGHIEVDRVGESLLLDSLPLVTRLAARGDAASAIGWLLDRILQEMTARPPAARVSADLHAQLLLVEIFRAVLADEAGSFPPGLLRLIADARLAPVVSGMHADPARRWSLEELARLVSMSRTAFVDRFREAAGVPPMQYLQRWRILLAERQLVSGDASVGEIAAMLGFGSESAFSTSFKRAAGLSPSRYRAAARI